MPFKSRSGRNLKFDRFDKRFSLIFGKYIAYPDIHHRFPDFCSGGSFVETGCCPSGPAVVVLKLLGILQGVMEFCTRYAKDIGNFVDILASQRAENLPFGSPGAREQYATRGIFLIGIQHSNPSLLERVLTAQLAESGNRRCWADFHDSYALE